MTVLGLSRAGCVSALHSYLAHYRELRSAVPDDGSTVPGRVHALLDRLLFDLEVDTSARATPPGISRMTEVEAAHFAPTVARLNTLTSRLGGTSPAAWLPMLAACETMLLEVLQHLDWRLSPGDPQASPAADVAR